MLSKTHSANPATHKQDKGQGYTKVKNVHNMLSHGDTPICQNLVCLCQRAKIAAELQLSGLIKLGWGSGELQFRSSKKPSIYSDDFLSHGMSVLSQYFHLVSTKCKMNKVLDIFIYLKYNKTNLQTPFKSQDENKYLQLNLID